MVVFAEIPDDVREGNTQSLVHSTSAFVLEQVSCKKKNAYDQNFVFQFHELSHWPFFGLLWLASNCHGTWGCAI